MLILDLTFPHHQRPPSSFSDRRKLRGVTRDIAPKLLTPKAAVRLWNGCPSASLVLMPEAAVNEDRLLPTRESDIWFSWEIGAMETEAITQAEGYLPD
jgi:hypothetical protein